jgi:hydroxymethylpyrimidine/phosphomethylpyrimidine kinase
VGFGAKAVLIKGGHLPGRIVSDLLFDGRRFRQFRHRRVLSRATHGTGCTLSSAIAANLARGRTLTDSVSRAEKYLVAALRRGFFPGRGRGLPDRFPDPV